MKVHWKSLWHNPPSCKCYKVKSQQKIKMKKYILLIFLKCTWQTHNTNKRNEGWQKERGNKCEKNERDKGGRRVSNTYKRKNEKKSEVKLKARNQNKRDGSKRKSEKYEKNGKQNNLPPKFQLLWNLNVDKEDEIQIDKMSSAPLVTNMDM